MTVNGISGANNGMQAGSSGRITQLDSVSKNIQNQIANAQKKLQELSSNEELSIEDKMKKRQEIQQEINNLNQQLRQHQMEQRKEQQAKNSPSLSLQATNSRESLQRLVPLSPMKDISHLNRCLAI